MDILPCDLKSVSPGGVPYGSNEREPGGWETGSVWPASLDENGELPRFSEMLSQEGGEQRHPKSSPDLCLHIHASTHTKKTLGLGL